MTIKSSCLRQIETLSMQCFCGVFVVFELNIPRLNLLSRIFMKKLALEFSIFKQTMNILHWTVFFFTQMNRVVDLTWYTGEGGGGEEHGFLHGLEL